MMNSGDAIILAIFAFVIGMCVTLGAVAGILEILAANQ